jgi:hypothetical protein
MWKTGLSVCSAVLKPHIKHSEFLSLSPLKEQPEDFSLGDTI